MKIASNSLELRILRTLTSGKKTNAIINVLNEKCFNSDIAKELYHRVTTLAQQRGIITTWEELKVDPAINEDTRKVLARYKKKPIKSKALLKRQVDQLQQYRKMRMAFEAKEYMIDELSKGKVPDIDDLISKTVAKLQDISIDKHSKSPYIDIGGDDKAALKTVKKLLRDSSDSYIPTGLKEFDSRNMGIPRGSFFMVQTNSGGGKSVFANQLVSNVAMVGLRACLVTLEMSGDENARRHVARLTDTNMGDVINPKKLSLPKKKSITKQWMEWHKTIKTKGGFLRIYPPTKDMTLLEILLELQPFKFDLILIDYIGLLKGNDGDDQARRMGADGRFAKRFAVKHNMAVGACAQLSDENKVRYSRALNEHSNLSFSWQFDESAKEYRIVLVELPKARNQDNRPFYLKEAFNYMRFEDIDESSAKTAIQSGKETKNENQTKPSKVRLNKDDIKQKKKAKEQKQKDRQLVTESDFIN